MSHRNVEKQHEQRQPDRFDHGHERQIGQQLPPIETAAVERRDEQPFDRLVLELELKRAVEPEHRRERERHPQDARRQIEGRHGGGIAPEVEHGEHEGGKHDRRDDRGARAEFE